VDGIPWKIGFLIKYFIIKNTVVKPIRGRTKYQVFRNSLIKSLVKNSWMICVIFLRLTAARPDKSPTTTLKICLNWESEICLYLQIKKLLMYFFLAIAF